MLGALFSGAAGAGALGALGRLVLPRARVADAELAPLAALAALRALDVSECPRLTSRALAHLPGSAAPPPSCTDWTRLVLLPVLTGHVSSFSPY